MLKIKDLNYSWTSLTYMTHNGQFQKHPALPLGYKLMGNLRDVNETPWAHAFVCKTLNLFTLPQFPPRIMLLPDQDSKLCP